MAFQINYGGDDTTILTDTIRMAASGEWVVKVTTEGGAWAGPVIDTDGHGGFTLAEWDDEDQATGGERTFAVNDVMELEIF